MGRWQATIGFMKTESNWVNKIETKFRFWKMKLKENTILNNTFFQNSIGNGPRVGGISILSKTI